jgi:hypothetical protein
MLNTYKKDGFLFFKENTGPDSILNDRLIIHQGNVDEAIYYVNKNKIKSITINPVFGSVASLDFLRNIPEVEGLYLLQDNLDVSFIAQLSNLRVLRIDDVKTDFDLSVFKKLEVLSFTHSRRIINLESCRNLFWLWIDGYKSDDLCPIQSLTKMQYLTLQGASIKNLEGINQMVELKNLRLDTMKNLESLKGLSETLAKLEVIDIYNAKKLANYSDLSKLKSLKQLELRRTGDADSISFIEHLNKLEKVTLGFKVLDGNMSYLKGIKKVGFIDFPHYTHKMKQF